MIYFLIIRFKVGVFMKRYITALSIVVLLLAVMLTACSKKNELVDDYGRTHVIATDKDGNLLQDPWGNLYEEVTDKDGNEVTQAYSYPDVSTNKRESVIENAVLKMKVSDDCEVSGLSNVFRLRHIGKCVDLGISSCQIEVSFGSQYSLDSTISNYIGTIDKLNLSGAVFTEPVQSDTEIAGLAAKCVSYSSEDTESDIYCYFVKKGLNVMKIEANVYGGCYDGDSIKAFLDKSCTFKELPTLSTTASTEAESN